MLLLTTWHYAIIEKDMFLYIFNAFTIPWQKWLLTLIWQLSEMYVIFNNWQYAVIVKAMFLYIFCAHSIALTEMIVNINKKN